MLDIEDGVSLRSLVLEQAQRTPDAPALVVGSRTRTYRELCDDALKIAALLQSGSARRPARVGIFAQRSSTAYAGTLGALFAGATFVPLNRKFPVARTRSMLRRAVLDAIVVDQESAAQLMDVVAENDRPLRIITPDIEITLRTSLPACSLAGPAEFESVRPLSELPPVLADDLAYLLFTSGSTGEPKGVGVTHANVMHYIRVIIDRYQLSPSDLCSQTFDPTFDLSVHDMFATWASGASLHVPQSIELLAPVRFVQKHGLTVWFSVPSVAALAIRKGMLKPASMPSLRISLFCGEPLPERTAQLWQDAAPKGIIENLYGPTELTIACFAHRWCRTPESSSNSIVPIGRPLPGLGAIITDDSLNEVVPGHSGELLVCGPQTTPGYWQDHQRTSERFPELPVSAVEKKRFYRTGDRVRRDADGVYSYIGRTDNQIKVLGFRVELGEIESLLLLQPGVVQAAAIGWPQEDGHALGIVAFVAGDGISGLALADRARALLPPYMVPQQVIVADGLPLNSNGKIDRSALESQLRLRHS